LKLGYHSASHQMKQCLTGAFVWSFLLRILYIKAMEGNSWMYLFRNKHTDRTSKRVDCSQSGQWVTCSDAECRTRLHERLHDI